MSSILCKIGVHSWQGCRCKVCEKTRDQNHSWTGCRCQSCSARRDLEHDWDGCKCSRCFAKREQEHRWKEFICARCRRFRFPEDVRVAGGPRAAVVRFGIKKTVIEKVMREFPDNTYEEKLALECSFSAICEVPDLKLDVFKQIWMDGQSFQVQEGVADQFESTSMWGSERVYIVQISQRLVDFQRVGIRRANFISWH